MNRIWYCIMEGEADFRAATRKERLCFAAECGLGRLGHTGTPDGLEQPHEKSGPVLLQNVAPTPMGTHEHSRVHFSILRIQNPVYSSHTKRTALFCRRTWPRPPWAHMDPGSFGNHTKRTALFCCRMWLGPPWAHRDPGWFRAATRKERPCFAAECGPDPFWAHTSTRGSIFRS